MKCVLQSQDRQPVDQLREPLRDEPWEPFQKYIVPPAFGHASQAMYELPRLQDAQTPQEFIEPIELVQRQLVAHDPKLLIVVGAPGTGKSRLLAELARRVCIFSNETSITEQIVPILVTGRSFAEANGISVAEHLADSLNRDNKLQTLRRLDATAIEQLILDDRYRCLVMIDGADEVANPVNRKDLFKRVVSDGRMMLDERHLVILSTRPLYEVDDKVLRTTCLCYNLPVLDNDASDRLVRTTLGAKADEFTLAATSTGLIDSLDTPLLVNLAATLYLRRQSDFPATILGIYGRFLSQIQEGWKDIPAKQAEIQTILESAALGSLNPRTHDYRLDNCLTEVDHAIKEAFLTLEQSQCSGVEVALSTAQAGINFGLQGSLASARLPCGIALAGGTQD